MLAKHGVEIDSSYNLCYLDQTCGFRARGLNGPTFVNGMQEFPVTTFSVQFQSGYKPLEVGSVSAAETLATIDMLRQAGCRHAVISLHSFSFVRNLENPGQPLQPSPVVIRRLEKVCAGLAERSRDVAVEVMGQASLHDTPPGRADFVPCVGWRQPLTRKIVQGLQRVAIV
jgi:hypothetical protein